VHEVQTAAGTEATTAPISTERKRRDAHPYAANRLRASIVDLTFGIWALAVPTALGSRLLNTDGDAARHLRMGEFILGGGLFRPDEFSHTRPGEPFLQTEWLSQVSYALANRAGGLVGVAVLAGLIIAAAYALIVLFLRRRGADPMLAYLTGITAAIVGGAHWLARPHLFTLLGLAILLFLIEPTNRRKLWPFAVLFAVWANFHPGYIIGIVVLCAVAAGEWLEARLSKQDEAEWRVRARWHAMGAGIGLLASFFNPQGPRFLLRIFHHLGDDFLLGVTNEFMSPNFHSTFGRLFLVILVIVIAGLAVYEKRLPMPRLAVLLLLMAAGLHSQRNIPIFGVIALPLMALHFDSVWRSLGGRVLTHVRGVFAEGESIAKPGWWVAPFTGVALLFAVLGGNVAGVTIVPASFDTEVFPVEIVRKARAANLEGRIFNEFTWGGYLLIAWPEQKIFIDGMTDFFGAELTREHLTVVSLWPGWRDTLVKYDISLVLIPANTRLAAELRREAGWSVWAEDSVAILLRRDGR
jgi:hypothetical protein